MSAFLTDRIRLLLAKSRQPNDAVTGENPPSFVANTDIQFELGFTFDGALIDTTNFTGVTLAILPLANPDSSPLLTGSVTPGSAGWNAQPVQLSGTDTIPAAATFSAGGSYTAGVQVGGVYTWTRGANDLTLSNGSNVTGSNLGPTGQSYSGGSYSLAGLTAGVMYQWVAGSAHDTGVNGSAPATSFFIATGTDTLNGSGSTTVTAQVYPAVIGANIIPAQTYSGSASPTGSNLVPAAQSYSVGSPYGSYTLTGLTQGAQYYFLPGTNDIAVANLNYAGLFVATATSMVLTGLSGQAVTASVQATTMPVTVYGLQTGQVYYWTKGASDASCGSLNASGFFIATSAFVIITGSSNSTVTASLQQVTTQANGTFTAAADTVTLTGTPNAAVTASMVGNVGWTTLNDQHCVIPFSHTQTGLAATDGGYTQYAVQVTATTSSTQIVLGYGIINVYDDGFSSGVPVTGNIVPAGAQYNSSGNYTLNGTIAGIPYYWQQLADDATAPGLTASGSFIPAGTSILLTGTPSTAVTAKVYSVPVRPLQIVATLAPGAVGYNAVAVLPYTVVSATATIAGGANISATPDPTTYANVGSTGIVFNFSAAIPASGYQIRVVIQ